MNNHRKAITIVTGNKRKIWQAESSLNPLGITLMPVNLEIHEIQSNDPVEISRAKAKEAYSQLRKPLLICDHSWAILALNGFPGGYIKDVNNWFTTEDYLALMKGKKDRTIILTETVVYIDDQEERVFSVKYPGQIIHESRGKGQHSSERVVVFEGRTKTSAEHIDDGEHARDMDKSAWKKFGEWYKEKQ